MRTLTEMPWISDVGITLPTSTHRKAQIAFIDVRIEEMIRDGLLDRKQALYWYAKLPCDPGYLTPDGVIGDPRELGDLAKYAKLPDDWHEYALGLDSGDRIVKAAKRPRTEQGELSQEAIDAKEHASINNGTLARENLDRRLNLVLNIQSLNLSPSQSSPRSVVPSTSKTSIETPVKAGCQKRLLSMVESLERYHSNEIGDPVAKKLIAELKLQISKLAS